MYVYVYVPWGVLESFFRVLCHFLQYSNSSPRHTGMIFF